MRWGWSTPAARSAGFHARARRAGMALNAVGALRVREQDAISPDLAVAFFDGSFVLMGLASAVGIVVAMIATSCCILRTGVLPRWQAWLGFTFAIPVLLAPIAWLMLLLFPVWMLLVSVTLARRARH